MMELPDLQEILQKHKIRCESNKNKDFHAKEPTKAIDDPIVITVKDYDKKSINQALESKQQKVGVVVLVNGKPAMIKKRKKYPKQFLRRKLQTHRDTTKTVDRSQLKLDRQKFGRKLLSKRKIVRVRAKRKLINSGKNGSKNRKIPPTTEAVKEKGSKEIMLHTFEDLSSLTKQRNTKTPNILNKHQPIPRRENLFPQPPPLPTALAGHLASFNLKTGAFTLTTDG